MASQAFELVKYISRLYSRMTDAEPMLLLVARLIETSKFIVETSQFQTAGMQKVLVACLRTIMKLRGGVEICSLGDHGRMRNIANALKVRNKEVDITMLLQPLNERKVS